MGSVTLCRSRLQNQRYQQVPTFWAAQAVITNALRHKGQLVVIDIKGEVYEKTSEARRKMGQPVHVLDLRDDATSALDS
jgi:Type IV secretory system Conjugative DNA transfer